MRISYFPNVTAQSGIEQSITHLVLWEDSEQEVEEAVEHQIYTICAQGMLVKNVSNHNALHFELLNAMHEIGCCLA